MLTVGSSKLIVLDQSADLGAQVERVTSVLRPRLKVIACDDFASVEAMMDDSGPADVLIAGSTVSSETGLQHLRRLRNRSPGLKLILVLDQLRGSSVRDIVRTGALDVLRRPVTDEVLLEAVEQALNSGPVLSSDNQAVGPVGGKGKVTTIVSATGGCGKTFLATNLGYHLQSRSKGRTCLLDLDLQFGELSTSLRLKPKYTIADLLAQEADNDDLGARLEEYLERHDTGVYVLPGPAEPAQADGIEPEELLRVIEAAQSRFDHVIVDTSAALSEAMLVAVDRADEIFVLATLDLPSVRSLGLLLSTFEQLKLATERAKLVLNKVEPDVGIDVDAMNRYFPQGFSMVIPYGRDVNRSLNMGQPVLAYAPHGEVSKALTAGFSASLASADLEPEMPAKRWLGWRQKRSA